MSNAGAPEDSPRPRVAHRRGCMRVRGEMTVYAAEALKTELFAALQRHRRANLLDLSQVTEFDTAGLQLLLAARRQAQAEGRTLRLVTPAPAVREVLELCHLGAWIDADPRPGAR